MQNKKTEKKVLPEVIQMPDYLSKSGQKWFLEKHGISTTERKPASKRAPKSSAGKAGDKSYYYLMNKDDIVASFVVEKLADGKEKATFIKVDKNKIFPWITDMNVFIYNRKTSWLRENMDLLQRRYGCDSLVGFLEVSKAVSLNDTLWVKRYKSSLCWDDVSPYRGINSVVSEVALTGRGTGKGKNYKRPSAEFTLGGRFAKCYKDVPGKDNKMQIVKLGSHHAPNGGNWPVSEFFASQVLEVMGMEHARITMSKNNAAHELASNIELFTSEDIGLVSMEDLKIKRLEGIAKFYIEHGWGSWFAEAILADAIICNHGRGARSFGVLIENNTGKPIGPAPMFNHNTSLVPCAREKDFRDIYEYIAQQGLTHWFGYGDSFESLALQFIHLVRLDAMAKLVDLFDFKFNIHAGNTSLGVPPWRLEGLAKLVRCNAMGILNMSKKLR